MKRFLIPLLIFAMLFTLSSCGEKTLQPNEVPEEVFDYKIGIVTGSENTGTEEYRAALAMREKYGDRIVLATVPDDLRPREEWTIAAINELAGDGDIKVIVIVRAVSGVAYTIEQIRKTRNDIVFICGDCVDSPDRIASVSDICLAVDTAALGESAAAQAKKLRAKTFVHISPARHLQYEPVKAMRDALQKKCRSTKVKFVEVVSPDPLESGGTAAVEAWMNENIPALVAKYGKNTAFYAASESMQELLITNVAALGAIVPMTCAPSLYHYGEAFGLFDIPNLPEETDVPGETDGAEMTDVLPKTGETNEAGEADETDETADIDRELALDYDDLPAVVEKIREKTAEAGNTGRMSDLSVPMNTLMVKAGVEYAVRWCEEKLRADKGSTYKEEALLEEIREIGGEDIKIEKYTKSSRGTLDNYYMLSCGFTEF